MSLDPPLLGFSYRYTIAVNVTSHLPFGTPVPYHPVALGVQTYLISASSTPEYIPDPHGTTVQRNT